MASAPPPGWQRVSDTLNARGESPFWHPHEERLYWVDVALRRLWRVHPRSGHTDHLDLPQEPGCVVPCRAGGLLLALRDGLYHLPSWNDLPRLMQPAPYDSTRQRFAAGGCDAWGRFWVGTHVDAQDRPEGALYCLHTRIKAQPELVTVERGVVSTGAVAWSANGHLLYWTDSGRHDITSHAMSQPGSWPPRLAPAMPWARFPAKPAGWSLEQPQGYQGRPHGAALDQAGRYWVAMEEGAQVLCLGPHGEVLARHPVPVQCPTGLCFGGTDLRTLYVTTGRLHRSADELARCPDSGGVFALNVEVPGLPVQLYWD